MHLIENELLQLDAKMPRHFGRQSRGLQATVGQSIHRSPIPRVVGRDLQVLHDEIPVALNLRPLGKSLDHERQVPVNGQFARFVPLLGARPFAARLAQLPLRRVQQPAGLDLRPLGSSLELVNLIPQRLDFRLLTLDELH